MAITLRALLYQVRFFTQFESLRNYRIFDIEGELWLAINGYPDGIPPHAAAVHYDGTPVPVGTDDVPPARKGAVWVGGLKSYLAYGVDLLSCPDAYAEGEEPWLYSNFTVAEEFMDDFYHGHCCRELAMRVREDLSAAKEILELLDGRGGLSALHVDRSYNANRLDTLEGEDAVRDELKKARRIMDERCAAINFGLSRTQPGTVDWITKTYGAYVDKWLLRRKPRGALIDVRNLIPRRTHFLDMVGRGVPVYYPLNERYLAQLSPVELRGVADLVDANHFYERLANLSYWPNIAYTKPTLSPEFGLTLQERLEMPAPAYRTPLTDRLMALLIRGKPLLASAIHSFFQPPIVLLDPMAILINTAAMLLVHPLTELRMMLWALTFRATNSCEILGEALMRGWAFRVLYPVDYLEELASQPGSLRPTEYPLVRDILVPILHDDFDVLVEWGRYVQRVLELLARPHAHIFLTLGGIYWRLALLFGHNHLVEWRLDPIGPSKSLIYLRRGVEGYTGYFGDEITEEERDLLLGVVHTRSGVTRSWFPPQDLLESYGFLDGEWSRSAEYLVKSRQNALDTGDASCHPLTRDEWEAELSRFEPGLLARSSYAAPFVENAQIFLEDMKKELGGSWNRAHLAEIDGSLDLEDPSEWFAQI